MLSGSPGVSYASFKKPPLLFSHHPRNGGTTVQKRDFLKVRESARVPKVVGWGGWRTGLVTDVDLSCWLPKIRHLSSEPPENTHTATRARLVQAHLHMLTHHKIHACHGTPAPETNHSPLNIILGAELPDPGCRPWFADPFLTGHGFQGSAWTCNTCSPVTGCAHRHPSYS